ncbi:MAG: ribose 5-phosphate isomerase B [Candidatus Thermoplasmatota archaeon]|nr:ribose 5-phosphate isomerase B [Candidatus Thermoplasmatota archaeon]
MKISLGADHGGFQLKEFLKRRLSEEGHDILDRGTFDPSPVDYPDIAFRVAQDVFQGSTGILVCGTGIGMCNAASRMEGMIAALCTNEYMARMARLHNDANVLCLGARVIGDELALSVTRVFLETPSLNDEKYVRRREKVARGCQ